MKFLIIGTLVTGACKFAGAKLTATAVGIKSCCSAFPLVGGLFGTILGAPFKLLGSVLGFVGFLFYFFAAALVAVILYIMLRKVLAHSRKKKTAQKLENAVESGSSSGILGKSRIFGK